MGQDRVQGRHYMQQLNFRYIRAKNFICFGPEGIEIYFNDYGNLVLVTGLNYDNGTPEEPGSNGSGKSSLQDVISYGIYGKTVKRPKQLYHGDVVNTKTGKELEVEIQFDQYRILRTREPNKLQLWESKDHLWDKSTLYDKGPSDTQKRIEEIVGLSHQAFCNVMVFDDADAHSFLEADTKTKREITENLLGLDKYREYHEIAKKLRNSSKSLVDDLSKQYERLNIELSSHKDRLSLVEKQEVAWKNNIIKFLNETSKAIKTKQEQLTNTDNGEELVKFEQAQAKIPELQDKLIELDHKKSKLQTILAEAKEKDAVAQNNRSEINGEIQLHNSTLRTLNAEQEKSRTLINRLKNLKEGQECPTCLGLIHSSNSQRVIDSEDEEIARRDLEISKNTVLLDGLRVKFAEKSALISKLQAHITEADKTYKGLEGKSEAIRKELLELNKIKKPEGNSVQQVLESEIQQLRKQGAEKKTELDGDSPYKEILIKAHDEIAAKEMEIEQQKIKIKDAEVNLPYYEFWVEAFGDKGIRKFIVDGAIPALNSRIAYWLQHLIDNKLELVFDNELTETISRNGVKANYYAMSNGEKRRINLAVSQAFSYVMTLHSNRSPSLVFLDEITGGGIDKFGVTGVYNMIFELAKEKQVFVTTHNEALLDMLSGCEAIKLKKENDITVLV